MANQVNIENILLIALEMSNKNTFKMELNLFSNLTANDLQKKK
jgi:hypothetical protein